MTQKQKIYEELILGAMAYYRDTGATLPQIRSYISCWEPKTHSPSDDIKVLNGFRDLGTVVSVGEKWFFTPSGYRHAKGPSLKPEWQPDDSLILLSVMVGGGELVSLSSIFLMTDFIDRSFPDLEATHGALNRLVAARFLKAKGGKYSLTESGIALRDKLKATCKKSSECVDGLRRILNCPCCGGIPKKVRWVVMLDSATYDAALDEYIGSFQRKKKHNEPPVSIPKKSAKAR